MAKIHPLFENVDSTDYSHLTRVLSQAPGYNQSDEPNMMGATSDAEAIRCFLTDYKQTKLTYRSYLKEIERLVLWCIHVPKVSVSDLKREHLIEYRQFLASPEPQARWCGPRTTRYTKDGVPNKDWRPFAKGLSEPSIRKSWSILDSFFNYLVQNNYFAGNPLSVDKRRKGKKSFSTERWLERDEIMTTLTALDHYPAETEKQKLEVARAKYIILTLFYTGLRLAELTHHTMGDFTLMEGEWFLRVVGKGQKPRSIAVSDEYIDVLAAFRGLMGLPLLPEYNEKTPLVPSMNLESALSDSRVWQILKWAFEQGAIRYSTLLYTSEDERLKYMHKASKLRQSSTHWLRHSYGTYLVKSGCSIEKAKELMGHSDISTTMIYVHIAKNDLHESVKNLSLTSEESLDKHKK